MNCSTLVRIESDGRKVWKPKKVFNTQDEAIEAAKALNSLDHRINKVVPYRCKVCHKYHLGRNGKKIKEKDRERLKKQQITFKPQVKEPDFKVISWIDLTKIRY